MITGTVKTHREVNMLVLSSPLTNIYGKILLAGPWEDSITLYGEQVEDEMAIPTNVYDYHLYDLLDGVHHRGLLAFESEEEAIKYIDDNYLLYRSLEELFKIASNKGEDLKDIKKEYRELISKKINKDKYFFSALRETGLEDEVREIIVNKLKERTC